MKLVVGTLLIFMPFIAHFLYLIYHCINCLVFGGDWKYYFADIAVYLFIAAMSVGVYLIVNE